MRIEHIFFSDQAFIGINEKYILEIDALFIMQRIFTLGTLDDMKILDSYYGETRIKKEFVHVPYLNCKFLNLCCLLYDFKKDEKKHPVSLARKGYR